MRMLACTMVLLLAAAPAGAAQFKLQSADVKPGSSIAEKFVFNGFGCSGQNVSPALSLERGAGRDEELRADGV